MNKPQGVNHEKIYIYIYALLLSLTMLTLSSCGGGGGDSSPTNTQTGNTGGSTGTQNSVSYLDTIPNNETDKIVLYNKRVFELADIRKQTTTELFDAIDGLNLFDTSKRTRTLDDIYVLDTSKLTHEQVRIFNTEVIPKMRKLSLQYILYAYNLSKLSIGRKKNIHDNTAIIQQRFVDPTSVAVFSGALMAGFAVINNLINNSANRAKDAMSNLMDKANPEDIKKYNKSLGLNPNTSKDELKKYINNLQGQKAHDAEFKIDSVRTDISGGNTNTSIDEYAQEKKKGLFNTAKEWIRWGVNLAYDTFTGGSDLAQVVKSGIQGTNGSRVTHLTKDGAAIVQTVTSMPVTSRAEKQTKNPDVSANAIQDVVNGKKKDDPKETDEDINNIINQTARNMGFKPEPDGSVYYGKPNNLIVKRINKDDNVTLMDSNNSTIEIIKNGHKPEVIKNFNTKTDKIINLQPVKLETNTGAGSDFTVGAVLTEGGLVYSYTVTVTIKNNTKPVKVTIDGEGVALMDTTKTVGINGSVSWRATVADDNATAIITRLDTGEQRSVLLEGTGPDEDEGGSQNVNREGYFTLRTTGSSCPNYDPTVVKFKVVGNLIYLPILAEEAASYYDQVITNGTNGASGSVGIMDSIGNIDTNWQLIEYLNQDDGNAVETYRLFGTVKSGYEHYRLSTNKGVKLSCTLTYIGSWD